MPNTDIHCYIGVMTDPAVRSLMFFKNFTISVPPVPFIGSFLAFVEADASSLARNFRAGPKMYNETILI